MKKILALAALILFISQGSAMDKLYKPTSKIIIKGFAPKKKAVSHLLPKGFFIEERERVVVEKIKENLLYVYDKEKPEKEFCLENSNNGKQLGLFHKENNRIIDRRIKTQNIFDFQYMPICLLRGIYKVNDDHNGKLIYHGSGFRNSLNQIVTAGHNLYLEAWCIRDFCNKKNISLKNHDFDIDLLTVQLMFGVSFKEEENNYYYVRTASVNGRDCFIKKGRDFGIINLSVSEKIDLDDTVGSLPIALMPSQPHEYMGKNIDIVGYPGEKMPRSLWNHNGSIKSMDPDLVTTYDVDTTPGNSGSPGFFDLQANYKDIEDFPVSLVHTHSSRPFNSGQGFDMDILDFMDKNRK